MHSSKFENANLKLQFLTAEYKPRKYKRSTRGVAIVEGAIGLVLIIASAVASMLMLSAAGTAAYYKYKLGCVTDRVAAFVANGLYPDGADSPQFPVAAIQANADMLVQQLLVDYGLPAGTTTAKIITGTTSARQLVVVSVTIPNLPLLHIPAGASLLGVNLPSTITMKDTAAAAVPLKMPPAVLKIINGANNVSIPMYGPSTASPVSSSYVFTFSP